MSVQELRNVFLRIALHEDFYNQMLVNPSEALKDYELTDEEKNILTKPKIESLNKFAPAGGWFNISLSFPPNWGPPFVTIIPIVSGITTMPEADKEKFKQSVRDIRNSVGPERFDKIMQLIQQVQTEN